MEIPILNEQSSSYVRRVSTESGVSLDLADIVELEGETGLELIVIVNLTGNVGLRCAGQGSGILIDELRACNPDLCVAGSHWLSDKTRTCFVANTEELVQVNARA